MMRAISMLVLSAALGAGAVGAAVTLKPPAPSSESGDHEGRPGPDSGRVAILLDAIGKTDPVVCEMIADQIGNFWNSGEGFGVGGFAATSLSLKAAKDSIGGHITDPRAVNLLVSELSAPNPCVRRVASKMLGNSAVAAGRLRTLLGDASPTVREAAAHAAGVGEKRDVLAALETSLGDRDATVGAMAAWAIGEIEDKSSIPALVRSTTRALRRKSFRRCATRTPLFAPWRRTCSESSRARPASHHSSGCSPTTPMHACERPPRAHSES